MPTYDPSNKVALFSAEDKVHWPDWLGDAKENLGPLMPSQWTDQQESLETDGRKLLMWGILFDAINTLFAYGPEEVKLLADRDRLIEETRERRKKEVAPLSKEIVSVKGRLYYLGSNRLRSERSKDEITQLTARLEELKSQRQQILDSFPDPGLQNHAVEVARLAKREAEEAAAWVLGEGEPVITFYDVCGLLKLHCERVSMQIRKCIKNFLKGKIPRPELLAANGLNGRIPGYCLPNSFELRKTEGRWGQKEEAAPLTQVAA